MNVTRSQIVSRGVANRCPNCGERSLFPPGSLRVHRRCPNCGVILDPGEGFFLGPWVINYTVTVFVWVLPLIALGVTAVIPLALAIVLALLGGLGLPILFYRRSWSWWLMIYFLLLPHRLPANGGGTGAEQA